MDDISRIFWNLVVMTSCKNHFNENNHIKWIILDYSCTVWGKNHKKKQQLIKIKEKINSKQSKNYFWKILKKLCDCAHEPVVHILPCKAREGEPGWAILKEESQVNRRVDYEGTIRGKKHLSSPYCHVMIIQFTLLPYHQYDHILDGAAK